MHAWRLLGFGDLFAVRMRRIACACACAFLLCMGVCLFAVGGFVLGVFFPVY